MKPQADMTVNGQKIISVTVCPDPKWSLPSIEVISFYNGQLIQSWYKLSVVCFTRSWNTKCNSLQNYIEKNIFLQPRNTHLFLEVKYYL